MNRLRLTTLSAVVAATLLAACATSSPDVVNRYDTQRMSTVLDAVVLSTRPVVIEGNQSGIGATAGGVVGAVAGGSVGGRRDSAAISIIGAVVGGVVGNAVERQGTREEAIEILVQLRNGERRAIVQARGEQALEPGDSVVLVNTGGRVRVTKAPVPVVPAASAPQG